MPWGAKIPDFVPLRVAAAASTIFWLGLIVFIAAELSFDGEKTEARWWLQPLDDFLIFAVWIAACVATIASILAMRLEWRRVATHPVTVEPLNKAGVAAPGEGEQCNAL